MTPKIWRCLLAAIVAMLIFALSRLDAGALLDSVRQISPFVILLLVALQIATQLLVNLQWFVIAKTVNLRISFGQMLYANSSGAVIDAITPGVKFGGEVARVMQIKRAANCDTSEAAAAVAVQKIFSLGALFLVVAAVGGGIFPLGQFVFLGLALLFGLVFFAPEREYRWRFFTILVAQIKKICTKKSAPVFALSLGIWILYPAKFYILAVPLGLSFFEAAAITFAAYFVAMLPIFPGGLGGFEATMTGLLVAAGIAAADAAVVTVFFRFVTFWLVMLSGAAYTALYKMVLPTFRER